MHAVELENFCTPCFQSTLTAGERNRKLGGKAPNGGESPIEKC